MRIRTKLIGLMAIYACICALFLGFHMAIETNRLKALLKDEVRTRVHSFENILSLMQNSLALYVYDYTYWDEMVSFVSSGDKTWASENIDTSLKTYRADAAWVLKTDGSIVYAVSNMDGTGGAELPLPKGAVEKLFSKTRFCHFFVNMPGGIMEVRGATIHPSTDEKRIIPPAGYYLAGRLWDRPYLDMLGQSAAAAITVYPAENIAYMPVSDIKKGMIIFSETLKDWEGKPLVVIGMQAESSQIINAARLAHWTIVSVVIYSIILFLIILAALFVWVERPLRLISLSMAKNDPDIIKDIANKKNEFGKIAALIAQFTKQKNALEGEIHERRKTEKDIRDRIQDMEAFHKVAVDREIKMSQLKEEIAELKEKLNTRNDK